MTPSIGGLVGAGRSPADIAHVLDISLDEAWDRIVKAGLGKLIPPEKRLGPIPESSEDPKAVAATGLAPVEASPEAPTTSGTAPTTPSTPPPALPAATTATPPAKEPATMTVTPTATPTPTTTPGPAAAPAKRRGSRQKTTAVAAPPAAAALSAADRKALAVGRVYLIAEKAGCTIVELVKLISEAFGTEA
jgi:hypothetical protein